METKQKIIDAALDLFSEKGYDAVSVGQIAKAAGIKAPSLYNHFKSKKDIFQEILTEMEKRYQQQASAMQLNGTEAAADIAIFSTISEEQLLQIGIQLFTYFLHDDYIRKFRKLLTVEQYNNEQLALLYTKQYIDDPLSYQGMLFHFLIKDDFFQSQGSNIIAIHFYAPIYLLLTLCDRQPEKEQEALRTLDLHIRQFNKLYRIGV